VVAAILVRITRDSVQRFELALAAALGKRWDLPTASSTSRSRLDAFA